MGRFRELGKKWGSSSTRESLWQQEITGKERAWLLSQTAGVWALTAWLYYRSLWALLILIPVFYRYYLGLKEDKIRRKKEEFLGEFKDMIQSMASSLNTGYSVENAIRQTHREMLVMYPKAARINRELGVMAQQVYIHMSAEQIFEELAGRVRLEEVRNFSHVFGAAKRSGGDMIGIIQNTTKQIGDKIEVQREIETELAAKQYEFRVMSAIPYVMIAYMALSFPEFMSCLYGNPIGIGVMSICLGIYIGAYALGVRLVKIEV